MEFKTPEYKDTYKLIKYNKALKKVLKDNGVFITKEDYYELYGNVNPTNINGLVDFENEKTIKKIVDLLLENSEHILATAVASLSRSNFMKEDLESELGIASIPKKVMQQLFYTYKYSYTNAFFENNLDKFIPSFDAEKLEDNESAHALIDIFMKEFDKLSNLLDNVREFQTYEEIPFEYINYLTQLLGLEQNQFMIEEDQEYHFREIARNIIDIYRVKGTSYSYELFFDFLGMDANIVEFYWDRRLYYKYNDQNEETSSNKKYSYDFYLTVNDPRLNLTEKLCIDESITDGDMGEQHNIFAFDDLITKLVKYGNTQDQAIKVILGYNDSYINENGEVDTWTGDIYTYFKTNYITLTPSKTWGSKTITTQQSYQISKLVNFLTPIFIERNIILDVTGDDSNESFTLNWDRDGKFYFLDSEIWECTLSDNYKFKASKGCITCTENDYTLTSKETLNEYTNSLACSTYCSSCGYSDAFKMPIGEKIDIRNTSKYWGIEKTTPYTNGYTYCCGCMGKAYPFAVKNTNYWYRYFCINEETEEINYYCCHFYDNINPTERNYFHYGNNCKLAECKINSIQSVLYYPRDIDLAGCDTKNIFANGCDTQGNGYTGYAIKNLEREMCNYVKVDWITDCSIEDFIACGNECFNETTWAETDNRYWEYIGEITNLQGFVDKYTNVINYDYVNNKLAICEFEPNKISLDNINGILVYTNTDKTSNGEKTSYESEMAELLSNSAEKESYYLVKCNDKYRVYYNMSDEVLRITPSDITTAMANSYCTICGKKYVLEDSYNSAIEEIKCKKALAACTDLAYVWRPVPEYTLANIKGSVCATFSTFGNLYAAFCNYSTYTGENNTLCCPIYNRATLDSDEGIAKYTMFCTNDENIKYSMTKQVGNIKKISPGSSICLSSNNYTVDGSNFVAKCDLPSDASVGAFAYIKNVYTENAETKYKTDITGKSDYIWYRQNHLLRNVYKNRKIGQLIYSTKDGKMYKLTNFGYVSDNKVLGVKQIDFTGRLEIDGDTGKIYEFDRAYSGYDESDDIDNNIFLNNSRHIIWYELGKEWGTNANNSDLITDKRPTRQATDKDFENNTTEDAESGMINVGERLLTLLCKDSVEEFKYTEINGEN